MQALYRTSDLMLGDPGIDSQHERVLESMHQLRSAIERGRPREETLGWLDAFAGIVAWHFSSEAELMRSAAYPDAAAHISEHRQLFEQLTLARSEFAAGNIRSCGALALFAQVWTAQHIRDADRRLAEFLKTGPVPAGDRPALNSEAPTARRLEPSVPGHVSSVIATPNSLPVVH